MTDSTVHIGSPWCLQRDEPDGPCNGWVRHPDGSMARCPDRGGTDCPQEDANEARRTFLASIGFGRRYHGAAEDKLFGNQPGTAGVAAMVRAYWEHIADHIAAGDGMFLSGPLGTGKTLALALTAVRAWRLTTCRYITTAALYAAVFRKDDETVRVATEAGLLLLDEWGVEHRSDWPLSAINALMEERHANLRSTCIATNKRPDELGDQPEIARIVDRWRESCRGRFGVLGQEVQSLRRAG